MVVPVELREEKGMEVAEVLKVGVRVMEGVEVAERRQIFGDPRALP